MVTIATHMTTTVTHIVTIATDIVTTVMHMVTPVTMNTQCYTKKSVIVATTPVNLPEGCSKGLILSGWDNYHYNLERLIFFHSYHGNML